MCATIRKKTFNFSKNRLQKSNKRDTIIFKYDLAYDRVRGRGVGKEGKENKGEPQQ